MTSRARRCLAVLLVASLLPVLLGSSGSAPASTVSAPGAQQATNAARGVLERVVWDDYRPGRRGLYLYSAHTDGSDKRRIYDQRVGFATQLTLDRKGRRVAFAPCCQERLPRLVVVPVLGGPTERPLARHPELSFVGAIGWSPRGDRLVFEGNVRSDGPGVTALWTVRPDGRGLRRLITLPERDQPTIGTALAWTRRGIVYSDGRDLRLLRQGHSRLLVARAGSPRISGNGRWIVFPHTQRGRSGWWIARPDGTDRRFIVRGGSPGQTDAYYDLVPNYRGTRVLALRFSQAEAEGTNMVTWAITRGAGTAEVLQTVEGNITASWN